MEPVRRNSANPIVQLINKAQDETKSKSVGALAKQLGLTKQNLYAAYREERPLPVLAILALCKAAKMPKPEKTALFLYEDQ